MRRGIAPTSGMSEQPDLVVDASVVVKWHLTDEVLSDAADAVRLDYTEGRISLIAPEHIRFEVPSAIRKATRTRRMTPDEGARAVHAFLRWRIPSAGDDALIVAAFDQSVRLGCSYYDALYLVLAESLKIPFVYADNHLRNALAGRFHLALWIEDYRFLG